MTVSEFEEGATRVGVGLPMRMVVARKEEGRRGDGWESCRRDEMGEIYIFFRWGRKGLLDVVQSRKRKESVSGRKRSKAIKKRGRERRESMARARLGIESSTRRFLCSVSYRFCSGNEKKIPQFSALKRLGYL